MTGEAVSIRKEVGAYKVWACCTCNEETWTSLTEIPGYCARCGVAFDLLHSDAGSISVKKSTDL